MKTVTSIFLLLLIGGQALAGETYIGGMYGASNLNYDTERLVWEELATNQNASAINAGIQAIGGSLNLKSKQTTTFSKLFIGHRFNKHFGLEVFSFKMRPYKVSATVAASTAGTLVHTTSNTGAGLAAAGQITGNATATADLKGYGVRVNGYLPVTDNFEIIGGLGIARVKSTVKLEYDINGAVNYGGVANANYNGSTYIPAVGYSNSFNNTEVFNENSSKTNTESGIVPVLSLGGQYRFNKHLSLRVEAEMVGVPVNGMAITTISGGMQYSF